MQSTLPQSNQRNKRHVFGGLVLTALLFALSLFVMWNRQYIVDSIIFWQYQPSAAVQQLTSRAYLTDSGKFIFYASQPRLDGSRAFNTKCDQQEESTAILGCYAANRIYIYNVSNAKLEGIKEVTAVHEMLHAVYQRLSDGERKAVDKLVEAEYEKLKEDPTYTERMAYYARTEPGARNNELYSIIGTEIASISPELEAHYKKYIHDRSKIVAYFANYSGTFTELANHAKALSSQLDALSTEIKEATERYNTNTKQLNADIEAFNKRAETGDFTSQVQFNKERQTLVIRSDNLAAQRDTVNTLVKKFNTLKDEYNDTVTQSNDLYKSINSQLAPAPSI